MGFSHILVAYDGGVPSIRALDTAIDFMQNNQAAQLTVVHVHSVAAIAIADSIVTVPASVQRDEFLQAQELLKEVDDKISFLLSARSVLLEGSPGESIVQYAAEQQCDLIVIGNRGLGAIREFVMGSVSHYVIQHTSVPLLLVK
ncbi:universal stress protein [Paenibacillus solisilvae]|uniref:Universal stress protein n=1 Tax=Paenibacillus solisilvae TaxID=2486751 RepID=A0ABW0VTL3_9BACL